MYTDKKMRPQLDTPNRVPPSLSLQAILLMLQFAFGAPTAHGQSAGSAPMPSRVVVGLSEDPARAVGVNWRTEGRPAHAQVQYATASGWTDFASHASVVYAESERVGLDTKDSASYHSALLRGLAAQTRYAYRVGDGSVWSEWHQFETASDSAAAFTFVSFGDAQHGLRDFVPRIFREAYRRVPDARFWLFTGDMTDLAQFDSQWRDLFSGAAFIPSTLPWMAAPGNHEYPDTVINGVDASYLHASFKYHFTFPRNGACGMDEECYTFAYQGVRFLVLNGNEHLSLQAAWMDSVLAKNDCRWIIAAVHQPLYSMGKKRDQQKTRKAFLPIFDKYGVDLVMQGHDHVYARSAQLKDGARVPAGRHGTVYVTSQCGSDGYPLNPLYEPLMEKTGACNQWYQVVSVNGPHLAYRSYTAAGVLFDSCELVK